MKKVTTLLAILLFIAFILQSCTKDNSSSTPVASFTCDKVSGGAPLTVNFTSTSTGTITMYMWDFGDGGSATTKSPSHSYTTVGTYTATLTVIGASGTSTANKTITVTQTVAAPVASFTSDVNSGSVPLTVNFTSTSTGTITTYAWTFGDGGTSSSQNPSHVYSTSGTFTVGLAVTGPGGTNSTSKTITVTKASPTIVANFTSDVTTGVAPLTVNFISTSTGVITSYAWNFGDDGTAATQNPSHTYITSGTFTVSLTATGPDGSNTVNKTITVTPAPIYYSNVTFNNPVFTDITVTMNGTTQTISPGGSVTFNAVPGSSVAYSAYTCGLTTANTQIGVKLYWNNTLTLTGANVSYNLIVTSTYFFVYITNSGTHTLNNLYVNYGLNSQSNFNIEIPNNSTKYRTGYFYAYTNSNIRMYYKDSPTYYTYWNQGTHFTLPWTNNQVANLSNTIKSYSDIGSIIGGSKVESTFDVSTIFSLFSAQSINYTKDLNAIDLYCK